MNATFETAVYDTKIEAFTAVKEFSRTYGFEVRKRDCKAQREVYVCRKSGSYDNQSKGNAHETKQRSRTATMKENCPWRAVAKYKEGEGWSVSTIQSIHTHISIVVSALSSHLIPALKPDVV